MRCPNCGHEVRPVSLVSAHEARQIIERLVLRYGSMNAAARAYGARHGMTRSAAERLFWRIRAGQKTISPWTVDRLEVFEAGGEVVTLFEAQA